MTFWRDDLYLTGWKDTVTGRQLGIPEPGDSTAVLNQTGAGIKTAWKQIGTSQAQQKNGSLQFDLQFASGSLEAVKSYVIYPGSSVVREWTVFKNHGSSSIPMQNPVFLKTGVHFNQLNSVDFHWMTGGENRPGSWDLRTETMKPELRRRFDSYDPFPGARDSKYEFKMGSASYAPWYSLYDNSSREGIFLGFDYFGHWTSSFGPDRNGVVSIQLAVAGYNQLLRPGESLRTPASFTAMFRDDLDNAGNECLDWQYQYMWDYTRPGWFPAIRMLGWWWNGTPWKDQGHTWVGGNGDRGSAFRKVLRVADLMSEVGGDVYHRDWGWWDRAGDWNGPDFKAMGQYLAKHGMGQLIYAFVYTVDPQSELAKQHPTWILNQTLDMSKPVVVSYLKALLDGFAKRFGPFEWRNDSTPTVPHGSNDSPLLAQDHAFREILRKFLDQNLDCAFQGVNGGGNDVGYDYARYASSLSFSDGAVGVLRNQWASLILPPDKSSDIPDKWQPGEYNKATWRGLLTINFDMTGDTWDPAKLEGVRQLTDIYHYLASQGVVGRWVHVYRPRVDGDDAQMYFERLTRGADRGIIIPKHVASGAITIWPKGLISSKQYLISYQESTAFAHRSGADLMSAGIHLEKIQPGELVYLNLPYHPGSLYQQRPSTPIDVRKRSANNMGFPGIEISWQAAKDVHWISYYEILRDGTLLDEVAKGTYYFDHSAGADLAASYKVLAVNGGGLRSPSTKATGASAKPSLVVDDSVSTAFSFSGKWERQTGVQPAFKSTLSRSDEKGASFELTVAGKKFIWFARLCSECGKASISIDGKVDSVVDTYSGDDIFGVGIYSRSFPTAVQRRIKVTVLAEHGGPRGTGTFVYVDGARIER